MSWLNFQHRCVTLPVIQKHPGKHRWMNWRHKPNAFVGNRCSQNHKALPRWNRNHTRFDENVHFVLDGHSSYQKSWVASTIGQFWVMKKHPYSQLPLNFPGFGIKQPINRPLTKNFARGTAQLVAEALALGVQDQSTHATQRLSSVATWWKLEAKNGWLKNNLSDLEKNKLYI